MKDYSAVVSAEVLALLAILVFATDRGRKAWLAMLGQAKVVPGAAPIPAENTAQYRFTPLGLIVLAFIVVSTARGKLGLVWAYMAGILLLASALLYYRQILQPFIVQGR